MADDPQRPREWRSSETPGRRDWERRACAGGRRRGICGSVRSRHPPTIGSPRRDGATAPGGRSSHASRTGRRAHSVLCPDRAGAVRGGLLGPEGTVASVAASGARPRRQTWPRELVPAPVTVADATVTGAGSASGSRRTRVKGCFRNPPTHPNAFSFPFSFSAVATTARGGHAWLLCGPKHFRQHAPSRAEADSRSLPAGAPRLDRHVAFLQGKDLLSLSPTGEEVYSKTKIVGDARMPGPCSRRLRWCRRH